MLVNPVLWDDRNDSYYIEKYAQLEGLESVYALCLAEAAETYHHWRVFSHGSGGACVEFDKDMLLKSVKKIDGLKAKYVNYKTIVNLRDLNPRKHELPFLKRYAFEGKK